MLKFLKETFWSPLINSLGGFLIIIIHSTLFENISAFLVLIIAS